MHIQFQNELGIIRDDLFNRRLVDVERVDHVHGGIPVSAVI